MGTARTVFEISKFKSQASRLWTPCSFPAGFVEVPEDAGVVELLGAEFVDFLALGESGCCGEGGFGLFEGVGFLLGGFEFSPAVDEGSDLFAYGGGVGEFLWCGITAECL